MVETWANVAAFCVWWKKGSEGTFFTAMTMNFTKSLQAYRL